MKLNVEGFDGFESGSKSMEDGDSAIEPEYYVQQKGMIQTMMSGYVDRIVSNLDDRFVESDHVSKFFVPSCIVSDEK